jgi:hypothetical protein
VLPLEGDSPTPRCEILTKKERKNKLCKQRD